MSRKYKFQDDQALYFVSFAVVNWIDLFIRDEYREILVKSIAYCQQHKGLELYAYCLMTSHVHLIISSRDNALSNIMRDMKRFTSERLHAAIARNPGESRREWMLESMRKAGLANGNNRAFQLWRQDNHPIELATLNMAWQKLEYIHENPVTAGFVERAEDWLYSSANNYITGQPGPLEIILLQP